MGWDCVGERPQTVPLRVYARSTSNLSESETTMTIQYAHRDRTRLGGWSVPVGAVVKDELKPCDHCGWDVNVLTIRTRTGLVVVEDDYHDRADEDSTICARCVTAMGPDE